MFVSQAGLALSEGGRPAFEFCTLGGSANCTLLHNAINGSHPAAGEWIAAASAHVAGSVLTVGILGHVPGTVLLRYGWSAGAPPSMLRGNPGTK